MKKNYYDRSNGEWSLIRFIQVVIVQVYKEVGCPILMV